MEPLDPDRWRADSGWSKAFVRWWPLWILLIILVILAMTIVPSFVGAGPAIGTGPTSTAAPASTAPGS